jgi:hypothetical protein
MTVGQRVVLFVTTLTVGSIAFQISVYSVYTLYVVLTANAVGIVTPTDVTANVLLTHVLVAVTTAVGTTVVRFVKRRTVGTTVT